MNRYFKDTFNSWVFESRPFVFVIDFEKKNALIYTPEQAYDKGLYYKINRQTNFNFNDYQQKLPKFSVFPVDYQVYKKSFDCVKKHLKKGNTYLLNLTMPSLIKTNLSLLEIFQQAVSPYKIYFKKQEFVGFSPETFVKIIEDEISTFPMKGTIDASIPHAKKILLENKKEIFEHNTIVDLMRNDLSMVATDIQVKRFRYVDYIKTNSKNLWQVSSEITGKLHKDWRKHNPVSIFDKLLPAGSISGAPKLKTLEIINQVESHKRGFYTGIYGYFDGKNFDTAVNIRYIENKKGHLYFRSGGGITALSDGREEYNELIQKIYVPII